MVVVHLPALIRDDVQYTVCNRVKLVFSLPSPVICYHKQQSVIVNNRLVAAEKPADTIDHDRVPCKTTFAVHDRMLPFTTINRRLR